MLDEAGEPLIADEDSGITFPSNDGFRIQMDFTAVWGIMPNQAANVIRKFGNVEAVEQKVVSPQIESICRNMGSTLKAVELLEGESRAKFQEDTRLAFESVLKDKDVTLQVGLVRHIYIPQEVRVPIQDSYISKELKLTREQEQLTTKTEADLGEAEEKVKLESERVIVETEKMVAEALAEGEKTAEETRAEATKLVAAIDKQTAELEAQATVLLGEANSGAKKLLEEAKAEKFKLAVEAFGSGKSYNEWVFATNLPEDIQLNLLYAGEGTFWTDLKGFTEAMLGRQAVEGGKPTPRGR
jgi:regulator of protease activity HflC (stomatin/prohibitin superfamily)